MLEAILCHPNFVETMLHYTKTKYVSNITQFGIQAGINCGKSAGNCVHFSVDTFDEDAYKKAAKQLAEGDLLLPAVVGYPPKAEWDAEIVVNYSAVYDTNAELAQEEAFAVTAKCFHKIPWT